nr:hypothetical protein [Bacillus paranthracis]
HSVIQGVVNDYCLSKTAWPPTSLSKKFCSTEVVKRAAVSVLCVVWSNERISDFSGKNYPEDVVNQAHIKARQLNVEPVLLSFLARVQWDRFQKTQRY